MDLLEKAQEERRWNRGRADRAPGMGRPRFKSLLYHFLAGRPWPHLGTSLSLRFPSCQVEVGKMKAERRAARSPLQRVRARRRDTGTVTAVTRAFASFLGTCHGNL